MKNKQKSKENEQIKEKKLLSFPRWKDIIMCIGQNPTMYPSKVAKITNTTYSHVIAVLEQLKQKGIVSFNKQGRVNFVSLTSEGENIVKHLTIVIKILEGV